MIQHTTDIELKNAALSAALDPSTFLGKIFPPAELSVVFVVFIFLSFVVEKGIRADEKK